MTASEISRAITAMETAAYLLVQAAEELSAWDGYDPAKDLETARELHLKALELRLQVETEVKTLGE